MADNRGPDRRRSGPHRERISSCYIKALRSSELGSRFGSDSHSYHHPDWDTATYDSEDKVLLPHHTVEGEKNIDVEADFSMTLKVDRHGKPKSIAEFSFDDDNFVWVSIGPNDYDYK